MRNQLLDCIQKYVETEHFSGVVYIRKENQMVLHKAFGYAHRGLKVNNQIDTKFDTASITKVFTAVGILQLVENDGLDLHSKVHDLLDLSHTNIDSHVTIYQLLTHTSGIGDDADEEAGEDYEAIWQSKPNYTMKKTTDYLEQFVYKDANFPPGAGCRYNNCAYILLGLIIEKLSNMSYHDYIRTYIFERASMQDTGFFRMDEVIEGVAEHYVSDYDEQGNVIGYRKNIYSYPFVGSADAGALTTASDLALFLHALAEGKLLNEKYTEELFKPHELYEKYQNYSSWMGYGFQYVIDNNHHNIYYRYKDGNNAGVSCTMNVYPENDVTMIILSNQDSDVWTLADELVEIVKEGESIDH